MSRHVISFYLRRSRQIRERKTLFLLLLMLLLGTIFQVPMYSFLGCTKAKTFVSKRV